MLFFLNTEKIQQTGHILVLIYGRPHPQNVSMEWKVLLKIGPWFSYSSFSTFWHVYLILNLDRALCLLLFQSLSYICIVSRMREIYQDVCLSHIVNLILSWKTYLLLYFNYWSKCWARNYLPICYEVICMYHIYLYYLVVSMGKINRQLCIVSSVICNATKSVTILVVSTTLRDSHTLSYLPNIL